MAEDKNQNDDDFKIDAPLDYIDSELNDSENSSSGEISDLDSFFEDLSNLENEEKDDSLGAAENLDTAFTPPPPPPPKAKKSPKPKRPKIKKPRKNFKFPFKWVLLLLILLLVGGAIYYLFPTAKEIAEGLSFSEDREENFPELPEPTPVEPPLPILVQPAEKNLGKITTSSSRVSRIGPIHAGISGNWKVRIASCSYKVCIENIKSRIMNLGYLENDLIMNRTQINTRFLKLFIDDYFEEDFAKKLVKKINYRNTIGIHANTVKNSRNQSRVFLATIPNDNKALQTFEKIKNHLTDLFNVHYPGNVFPINYSTENKSLKVTRISIGPYDSRSTAKEVLADIKTDRAFETAYVLK